MKFISMRYNFENFFQREISQIAQFFGKLLDLRYLSRFFNFECFFLYLKNVRAVFMFENCIKSEKFEIWQKHLKSPSYCAIWYISQDFSVMNVFWHLKNVRAVFMFENHIKSENIWNLTRPSQIAQLLRDLRSF